MDRPVADVVETLSEWMTTVCTCGDLGRHATQIHAAAVFSSHCTPSTAEPCDSLVAAKCCLLFFIVDDGDTDQLDDFVDFLTVGSATVDNEPTACLVNLLEEMRVVGADTSDLRNAIHEWAMGVKREQTLYVDELTTAEYLSIRKHTIFATCLIYCWLGLLGTTPISDTLAFSSVLDIALSVIIIVNDIGSINVDEIARDDRSSLASINTLLLNTRTSRSRDKSIDDAVHLHNSYIEQLRQWSHRIPTATYTVVKAVVNGNLDGTRQLSDVRYAGSLDALRRLDRL